MDDRAALFRSVPPGATTIHPLILCGGAGTRLWPLSRVAFPKQFLPLTSEYTLFQETALRLRADTIFTAPIVACNEAHRFTIEEQLREVGVRPRQVFLESVARNTAPAITVAALWLASQEPDALMLVQPSDHSIGSLDAFLGAVAKGMAAAETGYFVTFGVRPDRAEPEYGYIRAGTSLAPFKYVLAVDEFIEKPSRDHAETFVSNQAFYWNSGIFLFRIASYLEELKRLHPKMVSACERALAGGSAENGDLLHLDAGAFGENLALSLDRAVMEHTDRAAMIPVEMEWSDVSSWRELRDLGAADEHGNVVAGDVVLSRARNCYIRSDHNLVAAIGLEDVVVVTTDDAVLVAKADCAADVADVVEHLNRRNRPEPTQHLTVFRPWGSYRQVDAGERFQVKRITVKPGASLSLQKHFHRAEHWIVVRGTAKVQRGEQSMLLHENESVYIPIGLEHRLENPGKLPLHLIEVQSGSYLGEDDIVRLSDNYGRT
jgi:mannose-1-phosphate guanylyltransferase / mannose-6-phosphate isomerase